MIDNEQPPPPQNDPAAPPPPPQAAPAAAPGATFGRKVRINEMHVLVGSPGSGKTTLMLELGHTWLGRGGWLFAHDVGGDFAPLCEMYKSVDEWRKRMRRCEEKGEIMPRGAAFTMMEPTPMTRLVRELAERHNTQWHAAFPMMVDYDESALLEDSGASHASKADMEVLVRRRHMGIAPVYNLQDPTLLHPRFFKLSTDVYAFRQTSEDDIENLRKRCGAPRGAFDSMLNAPEHQFLHYVRGKGFV